MNTKSAKKGSTDINDILAVVPLVAHFAATHPVLGEGHVVALPVVLAAVGLTLVGGLAASNQDNN